MPEQPKAPSLTEVMDQAKKIQQNMKWSQAELASKEVSGVAGADFVKVVIDGRYVVKSLQLSDEALQQKKEVLQDLIMAATNDALRKVALLYQEQMLKLTKNLGFPQDLVDDKDK